MPQGTMDYVAFEGNNPEQYRPAAQVTTSFVTMYTAKAGDKIVGLDVTNGTGGAVTVSLEILPTGGTTGAAHLLLDAFSIAAHERENGFFSKTNPFHLAAGDKVNIKASAGTSLQAWLHIETPK